MAESSGETRALWNRDFSLLWGGQLVSSLGKHAFALAALLWMKEHTGSATLMGLLMMAAMMPSILLGPVSGVFVDRWDRRKIIAWTDIAGGLAVLAAALVLVFLPGEKTMLTAFIFSVTLVTGLLDTFSQPSISASLPTLVPSQRLEAANAFNLAGMQVAHFLAQGLAGLCYRLFGAPILAFINAATYLVAGVAELFIRIPHTPPVPQQGEAHPFQAFRAELLEGIRFLRGHRGLSALITLYACMNLFVSPIVVTTPFFAEDHLGLRPEWYGYFMAAFGFGALAGYALSGSFPARGRLRERLVNGSILAQALLLLACLVIRDRFGILAVFLGIGIAEGLMGVHINTVIQQAVPDAFRGRVQALVTTVAAGAFPIGMVISGLLFDATGRPVLLFYGVSGAFFLLFACIGFTLKDYRAFLAGEPGPSPEKQAIL